MEWLQNGYEETGSGVEDVEREMGVEASGRACMAPMHVGE